VLHLIPVPLEQGLEAGMVAEGVVAPVQYDLVDASRGGARNQGSEVFDVWYL